MAMFLALRWCTKKYIHWLHPAQEWNLWIENTNTQQSIPIFNPL